MNIQPTQVWRATRGTFSYSIERMIISVSDRDVIYHIGSRMGAVERRCSITAFKAWIREYRAELKAGPSP